MSLREYLRLLRDGKWWITSGLLLGLAAGVGMTLQSTPSYVASTTLYIAAIEGGGEPGQAYQGSLLAEQKARAYAPLLSGDRIRDEVAAVVGDGPVAAGAVTVQAFAGNPTLTVQVADPDPQRAARIADAVATKGSELVSDLERPRDPLLSTVITVRVIAPAAVPTSPRSPNAVLNAGTGALIGLALGFLIALVRRNLDRSVTSREALETLVGKPLLGSLPVDRRARSAPVQVASRPQDRLAESVRQLRANLRFAAAGTEFTSLLVTSAASGEGKTSVVCNLAAAFGLEGDRVLLVDADLRRSRMGEYLGLPGRAGLTTVLVGGCRFDEAVVPWGEGLFDVLPSGPVPRNPSELLASRRTADLLEEMRARYDIVLIDSPALLPVADGAVLAGRSDAVLLVVRHGRTAAPDVEAAVSALRMSSARLLGSVFSMAPPPSRAARAHGYFSSAPALSPSDLVTLGPTAVHPVPEQQTTPISAAPPHPRPSPVPPHRPVAGGHTTDGRTGGE